jgi:hypothetical protein
MAIMNHCCYCQKKKKSGRFSVTDYILLVAHDGRGSLVKRGRGGERERGADEDGICRRIKARSSLKWTW